VRILLYAVPVILGVWAMVDCAQTAPADVRRLPRPLWVLVIAFIPVVGPIAWLTLGRRRGSKPLAPPVPPRPVAPDDDPDFLRALEQERRRQERARADEREIFGEELLPEDSIDGESDDDRA